VKGHQVGTRFFSTPVSLLEQNMKESGGKTMASGNRLKHQGGGVRVKVKYNGGLCPVDPG